MKLNHIPDMQESRDYTQELCINPIVMRKPKKDDKRYRLVSKIPVHKYNGGYIKKRILPCKDCGRGLNTRYHD